MGLLARLALAALFGFGSGSPAPDEVVVDRSFESLQGFDAVVINQLNTMFGTDHLPAAPGFPVEPGVYVSVARNQVMVFDRHLAPLNDGRPVASAPAKLCRSKCPAALFDPFRATWLFLTQEAHAINVDVPTRVLFGVEGSVPAQTLVTTAYAAAESRPVEPPTMYLLLNGGTAGLRARNFFLIPPSGLRVNASQRLLGLRVRVDGTGAWAVTALDPGFNRVVSGRGPKQLAAVLKDVKKRFPGKETIILEPSETATIDDLVAVMALSQQRFPRVVLSAPTI